MDNDKFFTSCTKIWNNIGDDPRNCDAVSKFKEKLFFMERPSKKPIFDIHDTIGIKYIFTLMVGLSPLECHKKRHTFLDPLSNWCDCHCALEDTGHFILNCHLFITHRHKLRNDVQNILRKYDLLHLFNNPELGEIR